MTGKVSKSSQSPTTTLRMNLLKGGPREAGISRFTPKGQLWGVLMDMGFPQGTATVVSLIDGTTSLYFSAGGGIIGGQAHDGVRSATVAFVEAADRFVAEAGPVEAFPLPDVDQVSFYFMMVDGVRVATVPGEELGEGGHALSELFLVGQQVVTELRLAAPE